MKKASLLIEIVRYTILVIPVLWLIGFLTQIAISGPYIYTLVTPMSAAIVLSLVLIPARSLKTSIRIGSYFVLLILVGSLLFWSDNSSISFITDNPTEVSIANYNKFCLNSAEGIEGFKSHDKDGYKVFCRKSGFNNHRNFLNYLIPLLFIGLSVLTTKISNRRVKNGELKDARVLS